MSGPRRRQLELNELDWWSNWARLEWIGRNAYLLNSSDFPEPFFNRAGLLECTGALRSLERLDARLGASDWVTVYASCRTATKALVRSGYRQVDRMMVLGLAKPAFRRNEAVNVSRAAAADADEWSRAYLTSFYGDTRLLPNVVQVARRLLKTEKSTLLTGMISGRTAGVLAIHRTGRVIGVYCVGTLPQFRKTGVAGTLISHAHSIASSERRRLFLQTLESDAAERFYLAGGFRRLYVKDLLARQG